MVTGSAGNLMFGTGKSDENDISFDFADNIGLVQHSGGRW